MIQNCEEVHKSVRDKQDGQVLSGDTRELQGECLKCLKMITQKQCVRPESANQLLFLTPGRP